MAFNIARLKNILRDNWIGLACIGGLWLLFFAPIITGQALYFLDDLKIIYYPLEQEYAAFQHQWQLPQWSHYFGFGHPLLAWGQLGFFTPLHLILRAFYIPPLILLQISVASYYLFGCLGAFIFGRRLNLSPLSSAIFAALMVFSGFFIGHLNHVNFYTSTMVLPWLLIAADSLIKKPTLARCAATALTAAIMALSGQPQVILYSFLIAIIILLPRLITSVSHIAGKKKWAFLAKVIILTAMAGSISLSLASLNLLPLQEFLPQTERNASLPPEEYYEFSYPPSHVITLVLPYFFGGHDSYWGAKGFQELAAFVGFAPLFLAGLALTIWKTNRSARMSAIILSVIAFLMATGKYSPLYVWLVESHVLPPLAVPGRFVFFFNVSLALLAAIGFDDIVQMKVLGRARRIITITVALLIPAALLTPFFIALMQDERWYFGFTELGSLNAFQLIPLIIGILCIPLVLAGKQFAKLRTAISIGLTLTVVLPLLLYSWDYNPRLPRNVALGSNLFAEDLQKAGQGQMIPPRIYSHERLLQTTPPIQLTRRTDLISPAFSVIQPFRAQTNDLQCIVVETFTKDTREGNLIVSIYKRLDQAPLRQTTISTRLTNPSGGSRVCFEPIKDSENQDYLAHITSTKPTGIQLLYEKNENPDTQAYFVRILNPTPEELERSRKVARLHLEPSYVVTIDREAAMLARHLQAIAKTSSARWIGALSIRPYREYIEKFFANDGEVIDGDGKHAIERNRTILDMSGVTHLIQTIPTVAGDTMTDSGFILLDQYHTGEKDVRLYTNPSAWPKAFLVPNAEFRPAPDETRFAMLQPTFDPHQLVILSGDVPPQIPTTANTLGPNNTATVTTYTPTRVDVHVTTQKRAYLVVTDSHTEQWQTFIDGQKVPHLIAYSVFKAAEVPPGTHTVSFQYFSPATQQAKKLATGGLIALLALWIFPPLISKVWRPLHR